MTSTRCAFQSGLLDEEAQEAQGRLPDLASQQAADVRESVVLRLPLSVPHVYRDPRDVDHVEGQFQRELLGAR